MGATNHPGNTSTNLGDKLNSLVEPALTDLGTKMPGWGWIVGAYESIKEWLKASSDYQKANDPKIGSEAQKEYKLAGDAHNKLAGAATHLETDSIRGAPTKRKIKHGKERNLLVTPKPQRSSDL
jgi:hypothetical protein